MANTKTVTGSGLRQYGLQLRCTEDSTSIPNNTSTISWSLVLTSGNYSFGDFWIGWTVKLGDKTVSHADDNYKAISISSNSSLVIASGTDTVTHNNDGTKTINIYGYLSISSAYPGPGDMSCSGDWALTTIPRASSMTLPSSFTIGSSGSITIQMASNTFSHTITYSGYGLSGTVANLNAGVSSTSWTPPTSFYAKLPSSTSGTVTLTLTTKSGSTTIGTATYNATIVVPTSIKPTAPTVTLAPVNTNAWISSKGLYVGGYSAVKVTSSATAGSGATISSYTISGSISGSGTPYTSGVFSAGAKSITVTATDSRGRTNSTTTSVTFLTYTYPGLTTFTALRGTYSGGSWTSNVNGDHIRVEAVPSVALSANGNTASVTVKIGGTNPSATSGNYYYFTSTNATTSYTVTGTVSDSVGNTTSRSLTVPTIEVPLNINVDLPGIGVGMIAQSAHRFEVAPAWSFVADGKDNKFSYMPYSFAFDTDPTTNTPTTGFHRIATITITGNMQREAIQFVVSRKYDLKPVTLSLVFINEGTTDPTSAALYYDSLDGTNTGNGVFTAFAYRTGTSSWDVYVHKSASQDKITVTAYVPYYIQSVATITYAFNKIDSVPSGATVAKAMPLSTGTWTPQLYDNNTFVRNLPTASYVRNGNLWLLYARYGSNEYDLSGVSTMLQIRGLPVTGQVISGQIYMGGLTGQGGDRTLQQTSNAIWFRPNITYVSGMNAGVMSFSVWVIES